MPAFPASFDHSALPRRPFKGKQLSRAQLLSTHRDHSQLAFRYEIWWWGSPPANQRPHHYRIRANWHDRAGKAQTDVFSDQLADVLFWREPGVYTFYSTPRYAADGLAHAQKQQMRREGLLSTGSFLISLN